MDFDQWYAETYGSRWKKLKAALLQPVEHTQFSQGLRKAYPLDESSLYAARSLEVCPGERVLDACAAPGGKTLFLAVCLAGSGELTANDRSSSRRARLHRVIREYLPEELQSIITVTGHNAAKWGMYEQNCYDKILLDVPCSSERHLLRNPKELSRWSPGRSKRLSIQQFALAAAALDAVKPGGRIVYSTCSLSPLENDQVIAKLLKRRRGTCRVIPPPAEPRAEASQYGRVILPDESDGRGPMYVSCIIKT